MKISIEMNWDLAMAKNPKIILISPTSKKYIVNATTNIYGEKNVNGVGNVNIMSIDAETDNEIVIPEKGAWSAEATVDFPHYKLNSPIQTINFK